MSAPVQVEQVIAGVTYPLRQQVLRPHQRLADLAWPGDDDPDSAHFAAYDSEDRVVGVASVRREAVPWTEPEGVTRHAWRLRGMATAAAQRGTGVGAAVLARVVDHVARSGGGVLWCNARVPAAGFYTRHGFATRGEPWEEPDIGPHVRMWRAVDPRR